jgi:hypothetical protein
MIPTVVAQGVAPYCPRRGRAEAHEGGWQIGLTVKVGRIVSARSYIISAGRPGATIQKPESLEKLLDGFQYLLQQELHIKHSGFWLLYFGLRLLNSHKVDTLSSAFL